MPKPICIIFIRTVDIRHTLIEDILGNSGTPPYGHLGDTVTSLSRPLFSARQNGHTFPYLKNTVNAVTR